MQYSTLIFVDSDTLELFNKLLDIDANATDSAVEEAGYTPDTTIETLTANFTNGYSADIKLCAGQSNFFGDNILFNPEGCEVCVPDCFDSIEDGDEFFFEDGDDEYKVTIVEEVR